jgi:hypothetical protein
MSNVIESWNEEKQQTEGVTITLDSKVMLGCDGSPVVRVSGWMAMQGIETLEEMCDYINRLDFNTQVII